MPDGDAGERIREHVRRIFSAAQSPPGGTAGQNPGPADRLDKSVEVDRENDASSGDAGDLKRPS